MPKKNSFSLIELLTAIGIISLLLAIAIPSYRDYLCRAKIAEAVVILRDFEKSGTVAYQLTGTIPSSVDYGGSTIAAGSSVVYTSKYVNALHYNKDNDSATMWYCISLSSNVGIPGMGAAWGTSTWICSHTYLVNNMLTSVCGDWSSDPAFVPAAYLPKGCNCTNINSTISPGC